MSPFLCYISPHEFFRNNHDEKYLSVEVASTHYLLFGNVDNRFLYRLISIIRTSVQFLNKKSLIYLAGYTQHHRSHGFASVAKASVNEARRG